MAISLLLFFITIASGYVITHRRKSCLIHRNNELWRLEILSSTRDKGNQRPGGINEGRCGKEIEECARREKRCGSSSGYSSSAVENLPSHCGTQIPSHYYNYLLAAILGYIEGSPGFFSLRDSPNYDIDSTSFLLADIHPQKLLCMIHWSLWTEAIRIQEELPALWWDHVSRSTFKQDLGRVYAFRGSRVGVFKQVGHKQRDEKNRLTGLRIGQRDYTKIGRLFALQAVPSQSIPDPESDRFPQQPRKKKKRSFDSKVAIVKGFVDLFGELPKTNGTRMDAMEDRMHKFLNAQLLMKKQGKLSRVKVSALETIPGLEWMTQGSPTFNESVVTVKAFVETYGELPRQKGTRMDGEEKRLAAFVSKQRLMKKRKKLSPDRISAMESIIGFYWELCDLRDSIEAVKAFAKTYGELPKSKGTRMNGREKKLASFLAKQRLLKDRGQLLPDEISAMASITGFDWISGEYYTFEERLADVKAFVSAHGRLPKRDGMDGAENKLGAFLNEKRRLKKNDKLSPDQISAMESIHGFKWEIQLSFDDSVVAVETFVKEFDELPMQTGTRWDGQEKRLGGFLNSQRQFKKSGKLSPEQISTLEGIPGFEWNDNIVSVKTNLACVMEFVDTYGELPKQRGTRMDGEEKRLGNFLARQKQLKKSDKLLPDEVASLESIHGFEWRVGKQ